MILWVVYSKNMFSESLILGLYRKMFLTLNSTHLGLDNSDVGAL